MGVDVDVHHLSAHVMAENDAFVTLDKPVLRKWERLREDLGLEVVTPADAVNMASAGAAP